MFSVEWRLCHRDPFLVPLLAESFLAPLSSSDLEPLLILNVISSPLTKDFDIPGSPSLRRLLTMTSSAPTPKLKLAKHKWITHRSCLPSTILKYQMGTIPPSPRKPLIPKSTVKINGMRFCYTSCPNLLTDIVHITTTGPLPRVQPLAFSYSS